MEEEHVAHEVINEWNVKRGEETKKVFLAVPNDATDTPDLYCVIVDSYVDEAKVNQLIETDKPVVVLFSKYHDPKNSMLTELEQIAAFRETVQVKCSCVDYNGKASFIEALKKELDSYK